MFAAGIAVLVGIVAASASPCPSNVKCCTAAPSFCHTEFDSKAFCDPMTNAGQQLGDGCSCPWGNKAEAGKCTGPPSPKSYFCKHNSKSNSCGECTSDADCGNETHACWADKDSACPKLLTQFFAQSNCASMEKDFCKTKYTSEAFCDPQSKKSQQLGDGCSCPWGDKAEAGKCTGPAPRTYFCKHNAKSNGCGECTSDADCGDETNACWGYKDSACPKLLTQFFVQSSCASMEKDFCKTKYTSEAFCDPHSKESQQLGDGCSCPWGDKAEAGKCTGPAPRTYFCKHNAKSNGCGECTSDADCGDETDACWGYKDSACPKLLTQFFAQSNCASMEKDFCKTKYTSEAFCDPHSKESQQLGDGCSCPWGDKAEAGKCTGPAPRTYFCKHNAKSNGCGECTSDADCGNETHACWGYKDSACPKMESVVSVVPSCPSTFKCCTSDADFCHKSYDDRSFCEPATSAPQQLGDGCSCPFGSKAVDGKCSGSAKPYFCKHGAKTNACGKCSTDNDCGNDKNACWAQKDAACPKKTFFLRSSAAADEELLHV